MRPADKRKFGKTDLEVTAFSYGTVPIGNIFEFIEEQTVDAMIQHCWDHGIRFYDTAPMYGHGISELRLGHSLRWKDRNDYVLASKVGRVLTAARRSEIDFERWAGGAANEASFGLALGPTYIDNGLVCPREDGTEWPPNTFSTMFAATVRRGEVLALAWKNVDLDKGQISVTRSLEQTRSGLEFKSPKTGRGKRNNNETDSRSLAQTQIRASCQPCARANLR